MALSITIPKLGMNVDEVSLVEWKFAEGNQVEQSDIVLVIETQKTEWNVEAEAGGFLHIALKAGAKARVGETVGIITSTLEELRDIQRGSPDEMHETQVASPEAPQSVQEEREGRDIQRGIRISPVARKMAEEYMIDVTTVKGTGPFGRIVREDILRLVEETKGEAVVSARSTLPRAVPEVNLHAYQGRKVKESIPLRSMRKAIAEHMQHSLAVSAQMTVMGELDMTEIVRMREALLKQENSIGVRVSYTDIVVYVVGQALKDHADINCSLIDNEIKIWEDVNVGVAVAVGKEGLIVPVLRNTDRMGIGAISRAIKLYSQKAQEGQLGPDDVTGGTFTLTSLGGRAVSTFQTAILNQPESAILATGPLVEKPVVKDGQIAIAPLMSYSLTFDHRTINGFGAELFMGRVREIIQMPYLLLA